MKKFEVPVCNNTNSILYIELADDWDDYYLGVTAIDDNKHLHRIATVRADTTSKPYFLKPGETVSLFCTTDADLSNIDALDQSNDKDLVILRPDGSENIGVKITQDYGGQYSLWILTKKTYSPNDLENENFTFDILNDDEEVDNDPSHYTDDSKSFTFKLDKVSWDHKDDRNGIIFYEK